MIGKTTMKKLLIILYAITLSVTCDGMEQPQNDWRQEELQSYRYIMLCNEQLRQKASNITEDLIEAVVKKDVTQAATVLRNCPKQMLSHILNGTSEHNAALHSQSEKKYAAKYTFFLKKLYDDVNTWDDINPVTPLGLAIYIGDRNMAELLLQHKAHPEAPCGQNSGMIPLALATKYQPALIPMLIARGARVDGDTIHESPIFLCCYKGGLVESAQNLLAAGANLEIKKSWKSWQPCYSLNSCYHCWPIRTLLNCCLKKD